MTSLKVCFGMAIALTSSCIGAGSPTYSSSALKAKMSKSGSLDSNWLTEETWERSGSGTSTI